MTDIKRHALAPFAAMIPEFFPDEQPDDAEIILSLDSFPVVAISLVAFRNAAAALAAPDVPPDRALLRALINEAWRNGQTSTAIPDVWADTLIEKVFPALKGGAS